MLTVAIILAIVAVAINATMAHADNRYAARNAPRHIKRPRTDNSAYKFTPRRA